MPTQCGGRYEGHTSQTPCWRFRIQTDAWGAKMPKRASDAMTGLGKWAMCCALNHLQKEVPSPQTTWAINKWPWVKIPNSPSEHPNLTTKIGSKMGGEFTDPKNGISKRF